MNYSKIMMLREGVAVDAVERYYKSLIDQVFVTPVSEKIIILQIPYRTLINQHAPIIIRIRFLPNGRKRIENTYLLAHLREQNIDSTRIRQIAEMYGFQVDHEDWSSTAIWTEVNTARFHFVFAQFVDCIKEATVVCNHLCNDNKKTH